PEEGRRGAEARDRESEGGRARADRHHHPETMNVPKHAVTNVGLIGAGRMGMPMVGHLAARGFNVRVYDLDAAKRAEVERRKAAWQADSRSLAAASEVILICVGSDRQLRELFAPGGGLGSVANGTIVAVLSTVDP